VDSDFQSLAVTTPDVFLSLGHEQPGRMFEGEDPSHLPVQDADYPLLRCSNIDYELKITFHDTWETLVRTITKLFNNGRELDTDTSTVAEVNAQRVLNGRASQETAKRHPSMAHGPYSKCLKPRYANGTKQQTVDGTPGNILDRSVVLTANPILVLR